MWFYLAPIALAQERPAYVILDPAAREAGVGLTIDDVEIDTTLPVEVERGVEINVLIDDDVRAAWIEGGLVYRIEGSQGRIRIVNPGVNVEAHAVILDGPKAALDGLVDYLGAAVTITPRGVQVVREDVLAELSQAPVPDDDVTVSFLPIGASIGTVGTRLRSPRVSADTLDDEARRATLQARAEAPRKVFKHRRRAQSVVQPPGGSRRRTPGEPIAGPRRLVLWGGLLPGPRCGRLESHL